ncbi:MAG TPA: adenylyl cyclase [Agromyces mariniharenae]|nr:adenylyl cyclase [Agromyces mariniharenae]
MTHRTRAQHPPARPEARSAARPDRPAHAGRRLSAGAAIAALALGGAAITATPAVAADEPDFGPNVVVLDPSMPTHEINAIFAAIDNEPEFSQNRHAVLFKPGVYGSAEGAADPATAPDIVNGQVGYYTQVAGLGASPDDVVINGAIHAEGRPPATSCPWDGGGEADTALTNFWRSLSNVSINPIQRPVEGDTGVYGVCFPTPENPGGIMLPEGVADPGQLRWAVSQAAPMRRVHVQGDLTLMPRFGGYSSGGYLADSVIDGEVVSGSQQQWYTRDSSVGTWNGGVWNMVFSGVEGAPATDFGPKADGTVGNKTTLDTTPVSRPAPFLYLDGDAYEVFVPNARTDSAGVDWSTDASVGTSIPIGDFYIAHADRDTATSINRAISKKQHVLLTPGVYRLDKPINVKRAGTVVLGLGYASLTPTKGNAALVVDDVPGVKIAGITIDAGLVESDVLVQVGPTDAAVSDPSDPTTLSDVFIRVGGPWAGDAVTSIEVNSDDVLLDHIWAWHGDHGLDGSGTWTGSTGAHGVVVNGDDVTATGLFVEHYQQNQVIWNGERGRTVFYQSEIPYEVPSQAEWMDGDRLGYASYRVADDVAEHHATGMGVYSYFNQGQDIRAESGIQTPVGPGIRFESLISVFLSGSGGIEHTINDTGAPVVGGFGTSPVVSYPTP